MARLKLSVLTWLVTAITLVLNVFVYFYPDIVNYPHQCQWHNTSVRSKYAIVNAFLPKAPWMETVLLNFPSLQERKAHNAYEHGRVSDINMLAFGDPQINGNWASTPYIKRLDNYGNDYYLGHIYNIMKRRLQPSHVAVMGDQFSLQWIYDSEFYNRTRRFVERLFPRGAAYKKTVLDTWAKHEDYDWQAWLEREEKLDPRDRFLSRSYRDIYDWYLPDSPQPNFENPLFINLTGNHDVGYSGDATWQHMARFHLLFGQNNYVITYNAGLPEEWRLVVLDSLMLEGPALQEQFREYTWSFLENLKQSNAGFKGSTILLTHIPFYKKSGLCADGPEHIYYDENYEREPYKNGKLRSQNHLLYETTQQVLDIVFPNADKEGIILTGHDHVGCDTWYSHINGEWVSDHEKKQSDRKHIHEVVVRAMMGEFDGQTGLVTGQFDYAESAWKFEFTYCSFVIQHVWWASKVTLLLAVLLHSFSFAF
ncbi:hypothetical protein METBIDRAFT_44900 [Metschnikowia bicuspidata var. bicuspidata NRRL YB-4993]|uniref:Calcineurin-like phosphoesterase domain-containing protein n=1 Tax=Metschnikowia bicuspidata var. bicuspidata NRRL YB-4993 TaxID=869754 RepID=A0A1A0H7C6_9ASCO|nr:hypothetical protein METBIDRAFT_44900 [Metschnikowia bicuspidata var. bicuspidata NRRL YB-4993]OBA19803.1 hypothetical protein METBIDRAFT_44900 [Metschnikowia bicuspidata var. bicuspidata NRRL YB-4993]